VVILSQAKTAGGSDLASAILLQDDATATDLHHVQPESKSHDDSEEKECLHLSLSVFH